MTQAIQHEQMDAILASMSALSLMANIRYQNWRVSAEIVERAKSDPNQTAEDISFWEGCLDRNAEALRTVCEKIDEAMQYIGDVNNAVDAVDDYGMTDAAFAAMSRALGREETANN